MLHELQHGRRQGFQNLLRTVYLAKKRVLIFGDIIQGSQFRMIRRMPVIRPFNRDRTQKNRSNRKQNKPYETDSERTPH
ncbi:hypothetical protein [Granulibacter bethesdensis]|uniref:hypothetical protein n=1 Tax=Granulibacter bethesdensis TaxID=364410 RepID=UPI001560B9D4|nr:hypothetical protein [Granulibacter bethesdensis]